MKYFKRVIFVIAALAGLMTAAAKTPKTPKLPKGTTVYGRVLLDGEAAQGIYVSDGRNIVWTDKNGWYSMASDKSSSTVFVSFPGGTEVPVEKGMPQFWQPLNTDDAEVERHDFTLKSVSNDSYAFLAVSDIHLANLNDDAAQFSGPFMSRINEERDKYISKGLPVYCLNGGDSSYDRYWYEYLYAIEDFPKSLASVDFPMAMFSAMGNHDNDGGVEREGDVDWKASERYRRTMGPTWYSFNLGQVHYIVLDNIVYRNDEGRIDSYEGISGKRNYDCWIRDDQMDWLRRDLETVTDKGTPLVVLMHAPLFNHKNEVDSAPIISRMKKDGSTAEELLKEFSAVFRGFDQVHFISGHSHKIRTTKGADDTSTFPDLANITDHNVSGVCGVWWQTASRGGLTLSPDSAPAGFETFIVNGRELEWYFVSTDDGAERQFRVFDLNEVRNYWNSNGEVKAWRKHYPEREDYSKIEDNEVLIHVWAWENGWSIKVEEEGRELPVEALKAENPQFVISYQIPKASWEDNGEKRWPDKYAKPTLCPHFFRTRASSASSTLTVTVTDLVGRSWSESVSRPKPFSKQMR